MKVKFNKVFEPRSQFQGMIFTLSAIYNGGALCIDGEGNKLWFPSAEHLETYHEKVEEPVKRVEDTLPQVTQEGQHIDWSKYLPKGPVKETDKGFPDWYKHYQTPASVPPQYPEQKFWLQDLKVTC